MTTAYCFASGEILFSEGQTPTGALPIKGNCSKQDIEKINACSRRAYDGKTLLVPGIPEANDQEEACEALLRFQKLIER